MMIFLVGPAFSFLYMVFSVYFCLIFYKLYRAGDRIAPYILGLGICSFLTFFIQGVSPFLFQSGSWELTFFVNYLFFLVGYTGVALFAAITPYALGLRIKPLYFFMGSFILGIAAILSNFLDLQMTTVNAFGMLDRHFSSVTFLLLNSLIIVSFLPASIGIIDHSMKTYHSALKGILFTVGAFMFVLFVALSFTVKDVSTFIFLSTMCTVGWILMILSFTAVRGFSNK